MNGVAIMNTRYMIAVFLPLFTFFMIFFSGITVLAAGRQPSGGASANGSGSMDISVTCEWDDRENTDGMRPDSVTVELYVNGEETGRRIMLCAENGWRGSFDGLPAFRDGNVLSYSIIEARVDGYTGTLEGSDRTGYRIVNIHEPLPKGKNGNGGMSDGRITAVQKARIVETVITTKVSVSRPARTSTSTRKSGSAKTADTSDPGLWELMALVSCTGVFLLTFMPFRRRHG